MQLGRAVLVTSCATSLDGSSRSPKTRAPVGQTLTQNGCSPTSIRSTQKVHFSTTPIGRSGVNTSRPSLR